VEEGRQALLSYFQAKGFFDVKVDAQLKKDKTDNSVLYQITKEKKHKVTAVTVSGNTQLPGSELTPHLAVEKSHLFSPGKFSDRLVRSSVKNLTAVYQSEGFSSVKVASSVVNRGGDVQVSFHVTEGPRDIVNSIVIDGDDTFPESQFAPNGLKLAAGQPYSQSHVEADRANIIAHYLEAGYLTSSFRETAAEVSKADPHHINVSVPHLRRTEGDCWRHGYAGTGPYTAALDRRGSYRESSRVSRSPSRICLSPAANSTITPASLIGQRSTPSAISRLKPAKMCLSKCMRQAGMSSPMVLALK
jgi:hypothetical protein